MDNGNDGLFCKDLPTKPVENPGKVLVTGALGFIGSRLAYELRARGYPVRLMLRGNLGLRDMPDPDLEVVEADALNQDEVREAMQGVDYVYYLIHSMYMGQGDFEWRDQTAARNFRTAAEECGAKRIIYLGGLGSEDDSLSSHLRSRIQVAEELASGPVPVTTLRAAIIVGPGSSSYEIMENLIRKVPVIPMPEWSKNRCQPISVRDVIKYLVGVLETPEAAGKVFDIGGKDVLTYRSMLRQLARSMNRKRLFMWCPLCKIEPYAYAASVISPVPYSLTHCLMKSITNEVICQDDSVRTIVPFEPQTYSAALKQL